MHACAPASSSGSDDGSIVAAIESLDIDALREVAVAARLSHWAPSPDLSCNIIAPPVYGSFNLVYEARFSDGLSWALRIARTPWTELKARSMRLDIIGQQYITAYTSIPMPRIHAYDYSADNVLRRPYVVTDFVRGTRLVDVWNDASWWTGERSKERLLASVARHMVALAKLEFDTIGCLDRSEADGSHHVVPFPCAFDEEEESGIPNTLNFGPFESAHSYYLALVRERGRLAILRMLLATLPDDQFDGPPFHFGHPDFDSQNVLVAALTYPSWLTVDWDPAAYALYKEAPPYDSEADLHKYRQMYTNAVNAASGGRFTDIVRNSHVISSLFLAVNETYLCFHILVKVGTYVFGTKDLIFRVIDGIEISLWLALGSLDIAQVTESQADDDGESGDGFQSEDEAEGLEGEEDNDMGSNEGSEYRVVAEVEVSARRDGRDT
ncbi:hypothetical protein OH76DRAFT_1454764 [Lentinus brumalis]|uniref:Uncharacterized protein n=1 Tax=Lentinus brumalis TaxID=2498619 RepID=A0A371DG19_9APHY|nr:hypothetical protein OH76DRAFT_1454764 [Polyporus brumalis]